MADYQQALLKLMQEKQQNQINPEELKKAQEQEMMGNFLNQIFKSQALIGNVKGQATPTGDLTFEKPGQLAQANLLQKKQLGDQQFNQDLAIQDKMMGIDRFNQSQKDAELSNQRAQMGIQQQQQIQPLDLQEKRNRLELQKMELQKGGRNPTELDKELSKVDAQLKLEGLAKFYETTDPVKARLLKERASALSPKENPGTESQTNAAGYAQRVETANQQLDSLMSSGFDPTSASQYLEGSSFVPNALKSGKRQSFEQSERNFINAVLRRESGASISPEEFKNARQQYIPQPGDKPEVLKFKLQNRLQAGAGLKASAGDKAFKSASLQAPSQKQVVKKFMNSSGQTKLVYSDGTEEIK